MLKRKDINNSSLKNYIEYASSFDFNLIASSNFNDLYDSLLKRSNDCINEINTNILKLNSDKQDDYLESVRRELQYKFNYNKNSNLLDPYLKKYDLMIDDFPFSNNNKIKQILSKNVSDGKPLVILYKNKGK